MEVLNQLKPEVERELAKWLKYSERQCLRLSNAVTQGLLPPETQDFAQQMSLIGVEAGTQTEDENADDGKKKR